MTWLTWRQFRAQAAAVYALLAAAVMALVLVPLPDLTGSRLIRALGAGDASMTVYTLGTVAVLALPAIVGVFWGAPLVARELEAGTHRLAWSQSVTRTRWLATKLGLVGGVAVAGAALLSLLMTWWCGPLDDALNAGPGAAAGLLENPRLYPLVFGARGVVPIGYTAFAFALGVTAGIVVRRTVPAMAITLAVFVAVQVATPALVRAQLGPQELTTTITDSNLRGLEAMAANANGEPAGPVRGLTVNLNQPGAWIIANETLDRSGRVVSALPSWVVHCVPSREPAAARLRDADCFPRLAREGYRQRVVYQPADRYWTLQALETAVFLGLALALVGGSFWWIRRRTT